MSDLTLPIIALTTLFGYFFSTNGKNPRSKDDTKQKIEEFEKPNGKNIYSSNMVDLAEDEMLKRSVKNFKDSRNPAITGMLPPLFNAYSVVGSEQLNVGGISSQNLSQINDMNRLVDVTQVNQKQESIGSKPIFKNFIGKENKQSEYTTFNNNVIQNTTSILTGLPLETSHNNMVPFFGSNVKQNIEAFANQSLLDNMTGNKSTYTPKKEIGSLYDKVEENIYGAPVFSSVVDTDRYIPSLYKQNEKPFQDEKVFALKSGILENNIRPIFKDVNELRPGNKPKESYNGVTLSGQMGSVRGVNGEVIKKTPDSFYESTQDHLFKGPGAFTGNVSRDNFETNFKDTSRQDQNIEYYGSISQNNLNKTTQRLKLDNSDELLNILDSIMQNPKKSTFTDDSQYLRNATGYKDVNDYGKNSLTAYNTERMTTEDRGNILNANKISMGLKIMPQDTPKQTIAETLDNIDSNRNLLNSQFMKGEYDAYNKGINSVSAKTTQKESLIDNKYIGQANKDEGMGYIVNKYIAKTTQKEFMLNEYTGNAANDVKNKMIYSTYENPEKIRNAIHIEYSGNANKNNGKTSQDNYHNAQIRDRQEKLLIGERPNGPQNFQISSGIESYGNIKFTKNMQLKENPDKREHLNTLRSNVIPGKINIGAVIKRKTENTGESKLSDRFDFSVIKDQIKQNPYQIN